MQDLLKKYFGYDEFLPYQKEAIEKLRQRKSVLVVLPTGGGKSLIYQLPATTAKGLVLVFSPLISLMKDQVDSLNKIGIPAAFLNSTLTPQEKQNVFEQVKAKQVKILYIAPEGFFTNSFQNFLKTLDISLVAIDEAHCISEWGHDFRPEYRKLKILNQLFPNIPQVALTATATKQVQQDIIKQLGNQNMISMIGSFERDNLEIYIEPKIDQIDQIVEILEKQKGNSGIIYCSTRKKVDSLSATLNEMGFKNLPYHAGMESHDRTKNQNQFLNDDVNLIIATVAFGMGIHKSNIRYIIHANLPKSIEGYYQEIGRAGRDGLKSSCYLFYANSDVTTQQYLIETSESDEYKDLALTKLRQIMSFARDLKCRHKQILEYFGESRDDYRCERCDVCLSKDIEEKDITIEAQKVLSCIAKIDPKLGISGISMILTGSGSQKVAKFQHLSTYGIMQEKTQDEVKDLIGNLIDLKLIIQSSGQYPVLNLGPDAKKVLLGQQKVIIKLREIEQKAEDIEYETELFIELKHWRKQQSDIEKVPPYIIFSDKVLIDLSRYLPTNIEQVKKIPGIGSIKLERYGQDVSKIISNYCQEKNLESKIDELPNRRERRKKKKKYSHGSDTISETLHFYNQGLNLDQIAQKRELAIGTIGSHVEELIRQKKVPADDIKKFIPDERIKKIAKAFEQIGDLEKLSPIKQILPEDYEYFEIGLVRSVLELKSKNNNINK